MLLRCLSSIILLTSAFVEAQPHEHKYGEKHSHQKRQGWGSNPYQQGIFDYIVVGSGPGGAPLACRLARAGFQVLLIDAGQDTSGYLDTQIPSFHPRASELPEQTWAYNVERHPYPGGDQYNDPKFQYRIPNGPEYQNALYSGYPPPYGDWTYLLPDGRTYAGPRPPAGAQPIGLNYPRGSALGGSAQMNAMAMVTPWMDDWDHIAQITGNDSWNAEIMREYYIKLENCRYQLSSVVGHGFNGWLQIGITPLTLIAQDLKLAAIVAATAQAMGKGLIDGVLNLATGLAHILATDLNAPGRSRDQDVNIWQIPISINPTTGLRSGPVDFVKQTVSEGYPLTVQLNTFVTRILIDQSGYRPRAVGVQYLYGQYLYSASPLSSGQPGTPGYAYARREVVISGGAFETPKLLKLSGIGPADELAQFGIPTIVNLQGVGRNLQDRYEVGVVGKSDVPFSLFGPCKYNYESPDPCLQQFQGGVTPIDKGPYTSNGLAIGTTFSSSVNDDPKPDVFIVAVPAYFQGYYRGYSKAAVLDAQHFSYVVLKVRSRNNAGTVTLRSTNPLDMPVIRFNSFAVGGDLDAQAVAEGIQRGRDIFRDVIGIDGSFVVESPPDELQGQALVEWVKNYAWGHHCGCTAKIGAPNDPWAVVDGDFRVYGVDGLRIVDNSVWPTLPGYYPTIAIYMISEKAADVMLGQSPGPIGAFDNLDLGSGPIGTLGSGIIGAVAGVADPNVGVNGLLGSFGNLLGVLTPGNPPSPN
ncbi:Oxygen-dependent choline dehydrogenase [Pseudocercospora fuligena]|uniref:Oxygen-dependent choline dehydrogenase n=1 Tax=Pseudocercospora fuligena TaxID=685502 RepID=A0A8H6VE68_9PEZI|nr:Oxygen-dependent choline dehydrogenase [Pseudocercospora fuligena]